MKIEHDAFTVSGYVEEVLIGPPGNASIIAKKLKLKCGFGIIGDRHAGPRFADPRERILKNFELPESEVANHRQFSAISREEQKRISELLNLTSLIPDGCLGENIIVSGIPNFTQLPPGALLCFRDEKDWPRSAVLAIWGENKPCKFPGMEIAKSFPELAEARNFEAEFPKVAMGRRGVVGVVYASGIIKQGDRVVAHVPAQRIYEKPY